MSVPGGYRTAGDPTGGQQAYGGWGSAASEQDTGPIPRVPAPSATTGRGPGEAAGGSRRIDPAKVLGLVVAVLGALNFLWGFLPEVTAARSNESLSVFAVGPAYVPVLLLIAGLLALAAFLPGSERSRLAVAAVSVGGAAGAIVSLGTAGSVELVTTTQVGKGMGAILLVVFGIVQAVVAVGAYVIGADFSQVSGVRPATGSAPAGTTSAAPAWSGGPQAAPGAGWQQEPPIRPGWYGPGPSGYGAAAGSSWSAGRVPDAGSPAADDSDTGPQPVVDPGDVEESAGPNLRKS